MPRFYTTLTLGRSDSVVVQAKNSNKVKDFFNTVSESVVRNIKRILFSKEYNINYSTSTVPPLEAVHHKVIIQAMSENLSHTFILFNVKATITESDIKTQFKKLKIGKENITDFTNILFFEDKGSSPNIKNLYQVVYKRESRVYTEEIYAKSWQRAKEVAEFLLNGEIIEIRKFVKYNGSIKKDDGNYNSFIKVAIFKKGADRIHYNFKIPKVKKTVTKEMIHDYLGTHLQIGDLSPHETIIYT